MLSFKDVFFGLIPMGIYGVFYAFNVLSHIKNGKVFLVYDFYGFVQGGVSFVIPIIIIMFLVTFLISFVVYKINKCNLN